MTINVQIFPWDPALNSFEYILEVGLPDHMTVLFYFEGTSILLFIAAK